MANVNPQALARPYTRVAAQQSARVWETNGTLDAAGSTRTVNPTATQVPTDQTPVSQAQTVNP